VGAATVVRLATAGFDVVLTFRNKRARAQAVVQRVQALGRTAVALECDVTVAADRGRALAAAAQAGAGLDLLVLNASGGLEKDLLRADPDYPMTINRDAQVAMAREAMPLLHTGSVVVHVTSHWAHLYGQVEQLPDYTAVAASKHAGEQALRALRPELEARGARLYVVTGDIVEGTITARLLERRRAGMTAQRRGVAGRLPTVDDMAAAIVDAAAGDRPSGATFVVGGSLEDLLPARAPAAG
jgi:NAD(P)-dependent dehydrogenase (short-subunit alcohol dehydrogenase family)